MRLLDIAGRVLPTTSGGSRGLVFTSQFAPEPQPPRILCVAGPVRDAVPAGPATPRQVPAAILAGKEHA